MAFGDSTFGDSKVGTRGRGANNNRGGNNKNNKNRKNNNNNNGGGGGNNPFDTPAPQDGPSPTAAGATIGGIGSIFNPETAVNSGDTETYDDVAWGLLNNAGISNQAGNSGPGATAWLDNHVDDLFQQWEGLATVVGADRPNWSDYFSEQMTGEPLAALTGNPEEMRRRARQRVLSLYQSASPFERGYDSTRYVAPRRLIQF